MKTCANILITAADCYIRKKLLKVFLQMCYADKVLDICLFHSFKSTLLFQSLKLVLTTAVILI